MEPKFRVKVTIGPKGHITGVEFLPVPEVIAHGEEFVDSLAHYGVKGMKWGRRRSGGVSGPSAAAKAKRTKPELSSDFLEAKALKKKSPKEMSNAELKKLNERMQLEANYSQLMKKTKSSRSEGEAFMRELVETGKTLNDVDKALGRAPSKFVKSQIFGK